LDTLQVRPDHVVDGISPSATDTDHGDPWLYFVGVLGHRQVQRHLQSLQSWSSTFRDSVAAAARSGLPFLVMPAPAGIHGKRSRLAARDSRVPPGEPEDGNDNEWCAVSKTLSPISEVLAEPVADAADEAVRLLGGRPMRFRRLEIGLDGVGEEADGRG